MLVVVGIGFRRTVVKADASSDGFRACTTRPSRSAPAGWSKVLARSPWDLARSRTRSRWFRGRSGRVRWSRRARLLVTASLRGRPPPRTSAPRRTPPIRSTGTHQPSDPCAAAFDDPKSIGVLTPSWARRTPDETPSRTGSVEALREVRVRRLDLPPDHFVFRHTRFPFSRRRRPAGGG